MNGWTLKAAFSGLGNKFLFDTNQERRHNLCFMRSLSHGRIRHVLLPMLMTNLHGAMKSVNIVGNAGTSVFVHDLVQLE